MAKHCRKSLPRSDQRCVLKARTAVLSNSYTFHEVKNVISMQYLASLVPRLTPFFFGSLVSVDNNTRMRKGGEKRRRPGIIHHVLYVKWTWGGGGGQPQICLKTADKVVWII